MAHIEDETVTVRISTIDGDTAVRIPVKHLNAISELLAFIRDDQ